MGIIKQIIKGHRAAYGAKPDRIHICGGSPMFADVVGGMSIGRSCVIMGVVITTDHM